jgi:hypothetical protein
MERGNSTLAIFALVIEVKRTLGIITIRGLPSTGAIAASDETSGTIRNDLALILGFAAHIIRALDRFTNWACIRREAVKSVSDALAIPAKDRGFTRAVRSVRAVLRISTASIIIAFKRGVHRACDVSSASSRGASAIVAFDGSFGAFLVSGALLEAFLAGEIPASNRSVDRTDNSSGALRDVRFAGAVQNAFD